MRVPRPLLALFLAACSSGASGTLQIVTGGETDTFSRPPEPVALRVDEVDSSGNVTSIATTSLPTSSVDLGKLTQSTVASLEVTGLGPNGERLVFGASLPLDFSALDGLTVPLFVQRTGELARMPGPLSDGRTEPTLAILGGRYLFIGAGSDPSLALTTQLYDFASGAPVTSPPSVGRAPESIALVGTVAWLVGGAGATRFDFSTNTQTEVTAPAGQSFGDVAGGATLFATDGSQYIIGATRRTGAATSSVLAIDAAGARTSWLTLSSPRLGAAAAWVEGRGLVVVGGSASAAGVEVIAAGATNGAVLAYPPDPSVGAGATRLDGQHILVAGGLRAGQDAGARSIDLGCATQCAPSPSVALPAPLKSAQVFSNASDSALLVGNDISGATHVYDIKLPLSSVTEVPTKSAHRDARAIVSPVGSVVVFGGANVVESFRP